MSRIIDMHDLTDDFKLSFRSTGAINEAFSAIVARTAKDPSIRYRGKRSHRAAVVNAIILWLDGQPLDIQREVLRVGMDRLNRHLDADPEHLPDAYPGGASETGRATAAVVVDDSRPSEPKRRKKSG